jgi:hypothetical protein
VLWLDRTDALAALASGPDFADVGRRVAMAIAYD